MRIFLKAFSLFALFFSIAYIARILTVLTWFRSRIPSNRAGQFKSPSF
jgi:hypothetical protein